MTISPTSEIRLATARFRMKLSMAVLNGIGGGMDPPPGLVRSGRKRVARAVYLIPISESWSMELVAMVGL